MSYCNGVEEEIDYACGLFILFNSDGMCKALAYYLGKSWRCKGKQDSLAASRSSRYNMQRALGGIPTQKEGYLTQSVIRSTGLENNIYQGLIAR